MRTDIALRGSRDATADIQSLVPGQKLSSCVCDEDASMHPSAGRGRGAPEIDALEGSVEENVGIVSQSYQIVLFS